MKKFFALALALVLACSFAVTCFAATDTLTKDKKSTTDTVTGTYKEPEPAKTVYKVDVAFDAMSFEYTPQGNGVWNDKEHKYENFEPAKWEGTGTITVTNHSNAAVNVTLTYTAAENFENTKAKFTVDDVEKNAFTLNSAAPTGEATVGVADSKMATMEMVEGTLPQGTDGAQIGTVTVAFTEVTAS